MCYTSLTLNMIGTILTIATAALMLMFHPVGNAKARAIVKKILHKMCKCCFKNNIDPAPTSAELYGGGQPPPAVPQEIPVPK
jgi:hypothetical protein